MYKDFFYFEIGNMLYSSTPQKAWYIISTNTGLDKNIQRGQEV